MNEEPYPKIPETSKELVSLLTSNDANHINFSIEYATTIFKYELERNIEVERKASLLAGTGGIATVILTSLAGFLLNSPSMLHDWSRYALSAIFIVLAIAFLGTIFFSIRAVWVGKTAYPGPSPLMEGQNLNDGEYKKLHIADLFVAYSRNIPETNQKVDNLALAQKCFLGSLIPLLGLTIVFFIAVILQSL